MTRCSGITLYGRRCKNNTKGKFCNVHNKTMCGICLEETSTISLSCSHTFCKSCIYLWIIERENSATCPMCRCFIDIEIKNKAIEWGEEKRIIYRCEVTMYPLINIDHSDALKLLKYCNIKTHSYYTDFGFRIHYSKIMKNEEYKLIFEKLQKLKVIVQCYFKTSEMNGLYYPSLYKFIL